MKHKTFTVKVLAKVGLDKNGKPVYQQGAIDVKAKTPKQAWKKAREVLNAGNQVRADKQGPKDD